MKKYQKQSGQALLVVILAMVVAITLGLGAISQSITDVKISQEEEESARAFNLAEAGLEEALRGLAAGENFSWTDTTTGDTYTASVSQSGADGFTSDAIIDEGDVIQLLVSGTATTTRIYYQSPALEIIELLDDTGSYSVRRTVVYDGSGDYTAPGGSGSYNGRSFDHYYDLTTDSTVEAVRLRPLMSGSYIGVDPSDSLPNQYYTITATGQTEQGVTRKIDLTRDINPILPSVFDYAMFSGGTITK